jgi:hypothetical protein
MAGITVIRTLLILALIVTAHAIKPFSIKSVTNHLLYSTRSFKFMLPIRLQDNFDHANYLAINLSNSIFDAGKFTGSYADAVDSDFGPVAINLEPLEEINRKATRSKSKSRQSAPAKRIIRKDRAEAPDMIASIDADEIAPVELPPVFEAIPISLSLPQYAQPCLKEAAAARSIANLKPKPIEVLPALRLIVAMDREKARLDMISLIEEAMNLKARARFVEKKKPAKPAAISSSCEERKTEVDIEEIEIEVAEPDEEIFLPVAGEETGPAIPHSGPLTMPIEMCREL